MGFHHVEYAVVRHTAAAHAAVLRLDRTPAMNAAAGLVVEYTARTLQGRGSSAAAGRTRAAGLAACMAAAGRAGLHTGKTRTAARSCESRRRPVAVVGRKGVDGSSCCCCSAGRGRRCWGRRAGSDWGLAAVMRAEGRDYLAGMWPDAGRRWLGLKGIRLVCPFCLFVCLFLFVAME